MAKQVTPASIEQALSEASVVWAPQPGPQTAFIHCTWADEILFGGARGGGKSDAAIGKLLIKALQFESGMRGIFFRRTLPELEEIIQRSREIYAPFAKYNETKKSWQFHNGATIKMRFLDRDQDASLYQGSQYTDLVIEEAGGFPDPRPIWKLKACLRSARGVPCQMILTANPGGVGSNWVRARYIDPEPQGWTPIKDVDARTGTETLRIFIPSKVSDNQILLRNDPGYIARLAQSGSEQLVKAWLDGDWHTVDGAFFGEFDARKHVLKPTELPAWWLRFRAMDWGSAKPFCVLWFAVASEDWQHPISGHVVPKNALVAYREWYGVRVKIDGTIEANQGLKMTADQVAHGISARERGDPSLTYGVLDPSAFSVDGGPSIAERMYVATAGKVAFRRADNRRAGALGALSGWDQVRARLIGEPDHNGTQRPMIYFFETCAHTLRTLPMLQHDPDRPEDADTTAEDHACDAIRYACMSRPYNAPTPESRKRVTTLADMTLDQLWYDQGAEQAVQRIS